HWNSWQFIFFPRMILSENRVPSRIKSGTCFFGIMRSAVEIPYLGVGLSAPLQYRRRRRGAEEAGAVFIKINRLDGTGILYGPAAQSTFDEARPADRMFTAMLGGDRPVPEADIEARLTREIRFDSDIWIVEVEDRAARNFLDGNVVA